MRVTVNTSAREMVQLTVQEIDAICSRLQSAAQQCTCPAKMCGCGVEVQLHSPEQPENFGLVLITEGQERWLQDDFCPLTLQNPWTHGRLCVRLKTCSPWATAV